MKRLFFMGLLLSAMLILFGSASCTSTRTMSLNDQRRGLLMLEGDQIYKNKVFYKSKKSKKHRKKTLKASKKRYRR